MARPLWSGSISFGLVNIPVKLYTAQREHTVHFHQLHRQTGNRIHNKRVDADTGKEVDTDDIVKGYELDDGKWVTFEGDEIDELKPRSARTLDIEDFVDLDDIDPIFYDRTYFLAPADDEGATRAYGLLLAAMQDRNRAGIGRVVIRNKQYLAAVRPYERMLAMSTMHFADEVLTPKDAGLEVSVPKADAKTRKLAESLIDALEGPFEPGKYHDTYTEELQDLIERKSKGETIEVDEPEDTSDKVIDLMAALQASVEASKQGRSRRSGTGGRTSASRAEKPSTRSTSSGGKEGAATKATAKKASTKKGSTKKASSKKATGKEKASATKATGTKKAVKKAAAKKVAKKASAKRSKAA
jgi:DNA end-binding protein Ku